MSCILLNQQAIFGHDHIARHAPEAERKLQNSPYDHEKKGWDWDKYVTFHHEKHAIMVSLAGHGFSGISDGTKVCPFIQRIQSSELEAAVNAVWAQPEKLGKDFDATVSYLGQTVMKKGLHCVICPHCKDQNSASKS